MGCNKAADRRLEQGQCGQVWGRGGGSAALQAFSYPLTDSWPPNTPAGEELVGNGAG